MTTTNKRGAPTDQETSHDRTKRGKTEKSTAEPASFKRLIFVNECGESCDKQDCFHGDMDWVEAWIVPETELPDSQDRDLAFLLQKAGKAKDGESPRDYPWKEFFREDVATVYTSTPVKNTIVVRRADFELGRFLSDPASRTYNALMRPGTDLLIVRIDPKKDDLTIARIPRELAKSQPEILRYIEHEAENIRDHYEYCDAVDYMLGKGNDPNEECMEGLPCVMRRLAPWARHVIPPDGSSHFAPSGGSSHFGPSERVWMYHGER